MKIQIKLNNILIGIIHTNRTTNLYNSLKHIVNEYKFKHGFYPTRYCIKLIPDNTYCGLFTLYLYILALDL